MPFQPSHGSGVREFVAALLVILGLFGYLLWSGYQSSRTAALITADNLSKVLAVTIESALDRAQSDLRVFAPQITAEDLSGRASDRRRSDIEGRMAAHLRSFPAVSNYRVFDAGGHSVFGAGSGNPQTNLDVSDLNWFKRLRDDSDCDLAVSHVLIGKVNGEPIVVVGVAIRNSEKRFVGALDAVVNLSYFKSLIDGLDVGREGLVAIRRTDDYSFVVRRPESTDRVDHPPISSALKSAILSGQSVGLGEWVSPVDGVARTYAFRSINGYPFAVIVAVAEDDYLAAWRKQATLGGTTVLVLMIALVALFRRQQMARDRLSQLLRAVGEGICGVDAEGKITFANPAARQVLGRDEDELIGADFHALTHHHHADGSEYPVAKCPVHRVLGGEKAADHSDGDFFWRRDGKGFPVEYSVATISGGKSGGAVIVFRDITERKEAERRLAESEERFRSLIEDTTDWLWETDAEHRFTWISASADSFLAPASNAILGQRRWDLAAPEQDIDADRWQKYMADIKAHRSFRDFRYWIRSDDGTSHWLSVSGTPRFDADGTFTGYRGSGSDITPEAAAALRLKMLSTVVEQSPVSVVITDPNAVIEYVNTHVTRATGYEAAELIGRTPRVFASGETPAEIHRDLWATITAGRRWAGELRNRRKDGTLRWEEAVIAPVIDGEGRIAHYVAIKEDVTEARGLRDKLRQTNAELEQFAYVASHDLRQPLRMVTSYLGLIERRLGPVATEDIKTFLDYAVDGAKRMDRLILGLLDYSRTGRTATTEAVPLGTVIADALVNLTVAIRDADAEIAVADRLPTVTGDPTELTRLFQNLIGNAVKYRSPERKPKIEIDCRRQGREWLVAVKDNGIGIAEADRERAFAIFQRLVGDGEYEGTGIGLAVCKKIVEHHGGRIWIESQPGDGSKFLVAFPATER